MSRAGSKRLPTADQPLVIRHDAGGVRPETGKSEENFFFRGDLSSEIVPDPSRRGVEIAGPGVIAQAGPGLEDFGKRRPGQVAEGGKSSDKAVIVGNHGFNPGLLEHKLRNHDPIGIPGSPPGQVPFMGDIPAEKSALKSALLRKGLPPWRGPGAVRRF